MHCSCNDEHDVTVTDDPNEDEETLPALPGDIMTRVLVASGNAIGAGLVHPSFACSRWSASEAADFLTARSLGDRGLALEFATAAGAERVASVLVDRGCTVEQLDRALGAVRFGDPGEGAGRTAVVRALWCELGADPAVFRPTAPPPASADEERCAVLEAVSLGLTRRVLGGHRDEAAAAASIMASSLREGPGQGGHGPGPSGPGAGETILGVLGAVRAAAPLLRSLGRPKAAPYADTFLQVAMILDAILHVVQVKRDKLPQPRPRPQRDREAALSAEAAARELVPFAPGSQGGVHLHRAAERTPHAVLPTFRAVLEAATHDDPMLWFVFIRMGGDYPLHAVEVARAGLRLHAVEVARAGLRPHSRADPATVETLGYLLWVAARSGAVRTCVALCEDDELFRRGDAPIGTTGRRRRRKESRCMDLRAEVLRWFADQVKRRNRPENEAVIRTLAALLRSAGGPCGPQGPPVTRSCSTIRSIALDALENDADRWLLMDALS